MTSGTLSQNFDLGGLSFPRRFGVRFHVDYVKKYGFLGMQARWDGFSDKKFEHCLGKDFHHEDRITREGWAMYYFKGIFERDVAYVRLEILNPGTGMLIHTFYFEFKKDYQRSLDARYYVKDPILDEKIVKNGFLTELLPGKTASGEKRFKRAKTTFRQTKMTDIMSSPRSVEVDTPVITQVQVRYTEKPKMIFMVTPPHLIHHFLGDAAMTGVSYMAGAYHGRCSLESSVVKPQNTLRIISEE